MKKKEFFQSLSLEVMPKFPLRPVYFIGPLQTIIKPENEFLTEDKLKHGYTGRNKNPGQYFLEIQEFFSEILFNKFSCLLFCPEAILYVPEIQRSHLFSWR